MAQDRFGQAAGAPLVTEQNFPNLPGDFFDEFNLASLKDPVTRASVPDLKQALDSALAGDTNLLLTRLLSMPRAHLEPGFLVEAYEYLTFGQLPFFIANHEPAFSALENSETLKGQMPDIQARLGIEEEPKVLKTVTLGFRGKNMYRTILVSGVGDFRVDKALKISLGKELDASSNVAKGAVVNPLDFDTTLFLGLQPGMVKPIIKPFSVGSVWGVCYLKSLENPESFVAVSVSHVDSLIMRVVDFERLFSIYAAENYIGFEKIDIPRYVFYKNNRSF